MTDNMVHDETGDASRRAVMGGFLGIAISVPLVAACGSDDSGDGDGGGSGGSADSDSGGTTSSAAIATKSDVPVGSGKIFKADKVVVTQPTDGEFKAFSAVCTHAGCVVAEIKGEDITCTCHGSTFSVIDGSVVKGPATKPLAELKVTAAGEELSVS